MEEEFINQIYKSHKECPECPSPEKVQDFFLKILGLLFPDLSNEKIHSKKDVEYRLKKIESDLEFLLLHSVEKPVLGADQLAESFIQELPAIYHTLLSDAHAMYIGDPAARSEREVIRSYPGFFAIAAYRVAHTIYKRSIRTLPRMITEYAHSQTGIDIHPGASIGAHFCIDHGTGVVIGQTTEIGEYVKLYQGVTLGALSVRKEDAETKRHPTIQDGVIIYSGATILGGNTTVGSRSIIGGNVWLTESVPPDSRIYYRNKIADGMQSEEL